MIAEINPAFFIVGAILLFVIILAVKGFKIIPQSETMVIERLGKYHRTLQGGINIIWPIFDKGRVVQWKYQKTDVEGQKMILTVQTKRIDLREQVYDFPRQNVITKDNVNVEIDALLYFQITDPMKSVYEIINLPNAIEKLTQTTLRNVLGELELDESLTSRDTINTRLREILDEATDKWGVKVNRVELQDINPPKDVRDQMEKQMRAERDRRAAILVAEGQKQARILEAEGFKDAAVNEAEGRKQAAILSAEGEAQARIQVANAEAEAIRIVTDSVAAEGDPINYMIAIRYIDALKQMVSGKDNKVVYMPYEATGVLSSIGGIKDLLGGGSKPSIDA
jgi:regulator of protease activity HflC (stomatin/prohibitin superfamily)